MKHSLPRALAVAAAIALSVPAFAQVTINGYYRVGGRTNIAADGTTAVKFDDRIRLNLSFAAPDDMFGFKARLQANSSGTASGLANLFLDSAATTLTTAAGVTTAATVMTPPAISYAMGYAKFLDGSLKATAGLLSLSDYQVFENTGNIYLGKVATDAPALGTASFLNSKTGFLVQAWPIEGLSVGATIVEDGTKPALNHLGLDAYYFLPGFAKVVVASQLGQYSATEASASDDLSKSFVSAAVSYLGVPGMTATGAFRLSNGAIGAIAILEYGKGPFWANVSADLDFTNAKTYVEGEVSYVVIPQIKVRAYGAYDDGAKNGAFSSFADSAKKASSTMVGADLVFPIGKGELSAGVNYTDKANIQIPVLVKANF